ncbi:MAG: 3-hydroxyacyl-CoA dehydrogenase NAD-binding domain-containing protein, partial [Pseudomonadota bacterium]
ITPVLSLIRTVLAAEPGSRFTLVYANRRVSTVMFREELEDLKNLHLGRLNIIHVLEDDAQDIDLFTGRVTEEKKAQVLGRINPTTDYAALEGCDLIVEAVFEDPGVKAQVTEKAEAVIPTDAIFATNTSTLPISDLAKASKRPEQFIGIHFFSPVDKMMLVEIIRGQQTGDRAVAKALDFVRQIRKTPIVVNDARFFYANR